MKWLGAAAALALLAGGCSSDPELHVTVTNPTGVTVATTTITDYESPSLGCTDVEFAWLPADQLAALAVATETIGSMGQVSGSLDGISRTAHKVIVARGYGSDGGLVAAGCAEQDVVDGSVEVSIDTVEAVNSSIEVPMMAGSAVSVFVTDSNGVKLSDRPVSWTVYAPSGVQASSSMVTVPTDSNGVWRAAAPSCTSSTGGVPLHPVLPANVGGYEVQIGVGWGIDQPPLYTGFATPSLGVTQTLTIPANVTRYCTPHDSGSAPLLACIDASGTVTDYRASVQTSGAVTLTPSGTSTVTGTPIALVSMPNDLDRDAYAVTNNGQVQAIDGAPQAKDAALRVKCATGPCTDAIGVPACGTTARSIAVAGPSELEILDPVTGDMKSVGFASQLQLDNAGCVTVLGGNTRPVISVQGAVKTTLVFGDDGTTLALPLQASVGFAANATESRIILTSVDASGVILVQAVMNGTTSSHPFVDRAIYPAASIPDHIASGQFDDDSQADIVFDVTSRLGTTTAVELAYAHPLPDGTPLESLSTALPIALDDLQTFDLTSTTGRDDLIITGSFVGVHGVLVIASDAPIPASGGGDPPCSP
ncbi:MAG TPA: hypothetical protein VMJ10_08905 [Kofleriaceae bacterium]|nr:hypothetical protein [Kofleriaceae bacterium]